MTKIRKMHIPLWPPGEQYMMDRNAEIALVRTAAPEDVSRDATVLVMGLHGYETAVEGNNGGSPNSDRRIAHDEAAKASRWSGPWNYLQNPIPAMPFSHVPLCDQAIARLCTRTRVGTCWLANGVLRRTESRSFFE